ncbi:MAG: SRPBCC domain-containing protein [Nitriliruptorales bacterium]|nr:SRPBCC domain-containing protein [Nitriliruptorales bacterium]
MTPDATMTDLSTLDGRRGSTQIELSEDGSSYECVRIFGASSDRVFRAFTDPADLRVWFPAGAPEGSELTVCESDPVVDGRYRYVMVIPEYGEMAWHGIYTSVERPARLAAKEWFVMGGGDPEGPATTQTLTFEDVDGGMTRMTMTVHMPEPEDPEEFMEQSAAGLSTSLAKLDELVSS